MKPVRSSRLRRVVWLACIGLGVALVAMALFVFFEVSPWASSVPVLSLIRSALFGLTMVVWYGSMVAITIGLWVYSIRPPHSLWSRGKSLAMAGLIAFTTYTVSRLVLSILIFSGPLGFKPDLGGGGPLDLLAFVGASFALPAGLAGALAFAAYRKLRRLRPAGLCRECGYDLTGNTSGVCPECGSAA